MRRFNRYHQGLLVFLLTLGLLMGCGLSLNSSSMGESKGKDGETETTNSQTEEGTSKVPSMTNGQELPLTVATTTPSGGSLGLEEESVRIDYPTGAVVAHRLLGTLNTLNPHEVTLSSEEELAGYLFGALYHLAGDPETKQATVIPYHAADLPESLDQKNFTIHLKPGLTWSDGSPLTASNYVWSLEKLLDPTAQNLLAVEYTDHLPLLNAKGYQSGMVETFQAVGMKALDDVTLELSLAMPLSSEEVALALTTPLLTSPDFIQGNTGPQTIKDSEDWTTVRCSGVYELEGFQPNHEVVLKKRQDSVLTDFMARYFTSDYISLRHFDSNFNALEAFYRGELDLVPVAGTGYKKLKQDPRLHLAKGNTVWGIYVNLDKPLLANSDFRQALYWGTDRTPIAVGIFGSYNSYSGFVGPQSLVDKKGEMLAYRKTKESRSNVEKANVYNLNKAQEFASRVKQQMTEPEVLELVVPAQNEQMLAMAEFLKSSWESLFEGLLEIRIKPLDLSAAYERYREGEYQLGFGAMGQDMFDPWHSMMAFRSDFPNKLDRMTSDVFDRLHEEATYGMARLEPARRLELLQEMEAYLLEELPQIPLFVNADAYLISDKLEIPFKDFIPGVGFGLDQAQLKQEINE